MPREARQLKRRNHTVNSSYLQRFGDDRGFLTGVKLPGDRRFTVSVDSATVIKNFYVVRLPDGSESDQAEDDFCEIEAAAGASIRVLIDQRRWPIPKAVRRDVATWVALQYLRVAHVRRLAQEIAEAYTEVGVPFTSYTGEQTRLWMPANEADPEQIKRLHLEFIWRNIPVVAEMLYSHDWELTFFDRKSLITSDSPVVLRPMLRTPAGVTLAVANAGAVQVPLDRRAALTMSALGRGDSQVSPSAKIAADLNQAVAQNARRFLFHHPSDDPLVGVTLPQPRSRELSSTAEAAALAAGVFDRS
jgi:hypothetical protein